MNYKKILMLTLLAICVIGFSMSAVSAGNYKHIQINSIGTSHYFTCDVYVNGVHKMHETGDFKAHQMASFWTKWDIGDTIVITINSKAWRDFGWCKYRWEDPGTTKSFKYKNIYPDHPLKGLCYDTTGDTLFNGGNLDLLSADW